MTKTREQWLLDMVDVLAQKVIAPNDFKVPSSVYVSVGFPRGSRGGKAIGQCWRATSEEDEAGHIFISPVLTDRVQVAHVLLHELGHDIVGCEHGHKKPFADFCKAVGLVKPWTATTPSEELRTVLLDLTGKLGAYPHTALDPKTIKKQSTRMRLYQCPECDQKLRAAKDDLNILCGDCDCHYERR